MIAFIHPSPNTVDVCAIIAAVLFVLAVILALSSKASQVVISVLTGLGLAALAVALIFIA